jgi:outer membrane protein TolC
MNRASLPSFPGLLRPRRFARCLCAAGLPFLGLACTQAMTFLDEPVANVPRQAVAARPAANGVTRVAYRPAELPPAGLAPPSPVASVPAELPKEVPINFDTVLRLAEEQNAQISLARERLHESLTEKELAAKGWLPNVYAGIAYYRHEGGIQNEDGTLTHSSFGALYPGLHIQTEFDLREATFQRVNAERKLWQQKGELTKVTNETLLEAATTYIDLLTARRGEAILEELEQLENDLLKRVEKLITPTDKSATVLLEGVRAEIAGSKQARAKLHQQGDAASAKLAYLLGVGPDDRLVPMEATLTPIDLVDATPPVGELVARARNDGPGVHELEGLLAVIQCGIDEANGPQRYLPKVQLTMAEGAFGAGPGARLDWDNRWDLCIQARWNLTECLTAREKMRVARSKLEQVRLTKQDLQEKLTAGVREARSAILAGREQIRLGAEQVSHASEVHRLSKLRQEQRAEGASPLEVLNSIRTLQLAHFGYVTAISAYNKAQIRLLMLLGPTEACGARRAESINTVPVEPRKNGDR